MIQDGSDVKTVQPLMGHSRACTTLNVYCHLFEQPGQEVARRIQARIDRTKARSLRSRNQADAANSGRSAKRFFGYGAYVSPIGFYQLFTNFDLEQTRHP